MTISRCALEPRTSYCEWTMSLWVYDSCLYPSRFRPIPYAVSVYTHLFHPPLLLLVLYNLSLYIYRERKPICIIETTSDKQHPLRFAVLYIYPFLQIICAFIYSSKKPRVKSVLQNSSRRLFSRSWWEHERRRHLYFRVYIVAYSTYYLCILGTCKPKLMLT